MSGNLFVRDAFGQASNRLLAVTVILLLAMAGAAITPIRSHAAEVDADYSFSNATWDISDHVLMAYWDQSESDQRYRLDFYRDSVAEGNRIGQSRTVSHRDFYDFTKEILNLGAGRYVYTVTGLKNHETVSSEVLQLSWNDFHEIEDKYREEHPKSITGVVQTPELDRINGIKRDESVNTDGWLKLDNGSWYHFTGAVMDTGWFQDPKDGKRYYLKADGTMTTGWAYIDGQTFYFDASGSLSAA